MVPQMVCAEGLSVGCIRHVPHGLPSEHAGLFPVAGGPEERLEDQEDCRGPPLSCQPDVFGPVISDRRFLRLGHCPRRAGCAAAQFAGCAGTYGVASEAGTAASSRVELGYLPTASRAFSTQCLGLVW